MTLSIKDTRTGHEDICCLSMASDIIGIERNEIYRLLKRSKWFEYRHFMVNSDISVIKQKKRGTPQF
jgi:hypothetical protein